MLVKPKKPITNQTLDEMKGYIVLATLPRYS
jgi:hypothetical protein